jgi:hypothetical protein
MPVIVPSLSDDIAVKMKSHALPLSSFFGTHMSNRGVDVSRQKLLLVKEVFIGNENEPW